MRFDRFAWEEYQQGQQGNSSQAQCCQHQFVRISLCWLNRRNSGNSSKLCRIVDACLPHLSYESITSAWNRLDVAASVAVFFKNLPDCANVLYQNTFLYKGIRPHLFEKIDLF